MAALFLIALALGCSSGSGPSDPGNGGGGGSGSGGSGPDPEPLPAPTNFTSERVTEGVMLSWDLVYSDSLVGYIVAYGPNPYITWNLEEDPWCLAPTVSQLCDSFPPIGQQEYQIYSYCNELGWGDDPSVTSIYVTPLVTDVIVPLTWEGHPIHEGQWTGQGGNISFQVQPDSSLEGLLQIEIIISVGGGSYFSPSFTIPITGNWNGNTTIYVDVPADTNEYGNGISYATSFPLEFTHTNEVEGEFTISGKLYYQETWHNDDNDYTLTCTSNQ